MARFPKYQDVICDKCSQRHPHCSCKPLNPSWGGYPIQLQRDWHKAYQQHHVVARDPGEVQTQATKLHAEGWRQVSRRYRMISNGTRTLELDRKAEPFMRELRKNQPWTLPV